MLKDIRESDWKIFRDLHRVALARFCDKVIEAVARLAADTSTSSHERYGMIYEMIKERDEELAAVFNGMSRSRAIYQLTAMMHRGLLSEEEFARLSLETREIVQSLIRIGGCD